MTEAWPSPRRVQLPAAPTACAVLCLAVQRPTLFHTMPCRAAPLPCCAVPCAAQDFAPDVGGLPGLAARLGVSVATASDMVARLPVLLALEAKLLQLSLSGGWGVV